MPEQVIDEDTGEVFIRNDDGTLTRAFEGSGLAAFGVGAAEGAARIGPAIVEGVTTLIDQIPGAKLTTTREGLQQLQDEIGDIPVFQAAREAQPIANIAGQIAGGSVVPGNRFVQAGLGVLQGIGEGETLAERAAFGSLAGAGGFVGGRAGSTISARVSRAIQASSGSARTRARVAAARRLEQQGFDLSEGERAAPGITGAAARQRDLARSTLSGDVTTPKRRAQTNEVVADSLGVDADTLSDDVLASAADNVDELYSGIRTAIPDPIPAETFQGMLQQTSEAIATGVPSTPRVLQRADDLARSINANRMDGAEYLRQRKVIGEAARAATDPVDRRLLYGMLTGLDEVMEASSGVGQQLREANDAWRLLEVVQRPGVVNPQGDLNPNSFTRNMRRLFPGVQRGRGQQADLFQNVRDVQQFPGFRSSGTIERSLGRLGRAGRQIGLAMGSIPEAVIGGLGRGLGITGGESADLSIFDRIVQGQIDPQAEQ